MFSSFLTTAVYRRRFTYCLSLVILALVLVVPAFASATAEHAAAGVGTLLWPVINFTLYAAIMVFGYKRLAAPALKQQRAEIQEQFETGRAQLADAQRALETIKARNENIEKERAQILAALEAEGGALAVAVLEKAVEDVGYKKGDLARRMLAEQSKLRLELRQAVVRRAALEARAALSEDLDAQRDMRLRRDAISRFRA